MRFYLIFSLVAGISFSTCQIDDRIVPLDLKYGAEANNTGNPIGGGKGYNSYVTQGNLVVSTKEQLLNAFESATSGQVISIASDAEIDLSGLSGIEIPAGITLAGDRGKNNAEGPLLFTRSMPNEANVFWVESNTRITGIRFKGPDVNFEDIDYEKYPKSDASCFYVHGVNVEIDNCEISNFFRGGVEVYPDGKNVHIHHNFIHDVQAYPVVVLNKSELPILIEANLVHWIWTSVAGSGYPGNGYEARFNIFIRKGVPASLLPYEGHHGIDMHPFLEAQQERDQLIAGDEVDVHHNTFIRDAPGDPSALTSPDVEISGTPRILAAFYNNRFMNNSPEEAIKTEGSSNLWVFNNIFGSAQTPVGLTDFSTPQITLQSPPPPNVEVPLITTANLIPEFNVKLLNGLTLQKVVVSVDDKIYYESASLPSSGQINIPMNGLNPNTTPHRFTVIATDNRGVSGEHTTLFRTR